MARTSKKANTVTVATVAEAAVDAETRMLSGEIVSRYSA